MRFLLPIKAFRMILICHMRVKQSKLDAILASLLTGVCNIIEDNRQPLVEVDMNVRVASNPHSNVDSREPTIRRRPRCLVNSIPNSGTVVPQCSRSGNGNGMCIYIDQVIIRQGHYLVGSSFPANLLLLSQRFAGVSLREAWEILDSLLAENDPLFWPKHSPDLFCRVDSPPLTIKRNGPTDEIGLTTTVQLMIPLLGHF